MKEKEVLKKVPDALLQKPVTIDIDIPPKNLIHKWLQAKGWAAKQRHFEIRPLTLGQLQRISGYLLEVGIDAALTPDVLLNLMLQHSGTVAKIVAAAMTESRKEPTKELTDYLLHTLTPKEMEGIASIVLNQLNISGFLTCIISLRTLNVLENRNANAMSVSESEVNPLQEETIAPGHLSAVI